MENIEKPKAEVVTLTPFESQISELEALAKDYTNPVVTKSNYKEMNEVRLVFYRKRTAITRDEKANNDALNKAKKLNSQRAETLISIIEPIERDIASKLKAIDDAEELAKAIELKRVNDHRNIINSFGGKLIEVMKITDLAILEEKKKACSDWHSKYAGQEFQQEIDDVVKSYLDTIDGLIKIEKSKPKPEPTLFETKVAEFEKVPSNIPADIRAMNSPINTKPEPMEKVVLQPLTPSEAVETPSLEDRAKSGEFAIGVACNLIVGGYKFYIDKTLGDDNIAKINSFIIGFIESVNENVEAF